jgi:membrane-associated phospholipid phosphatase
MTAAPRDLLVAAALTAAAFFGVYALAYEWHAGGQLDGRALVGFAVIHVSAVTHLAHFFESLCEPRPYLVICVILLAIVIATRGLVLAGAVAVVLVAANASTEALKPLIASASGTHLGPLSEVGVGSYPSGHSTAAMALACAVVIAGRRAYRPLCTLAGGLFVLAVSWSILVLSSHLPSDVIGGWLVATFWALVVLAGLSTLPARLHTALRRRPRPRADVPSPSLVTVAAIIVSVGAAADILALLRIRPLAVRASSLIDFGSVAVLLTLLCAALICGVASVADRPAR